MSFGTESQRRFYSEMQSPFLQKFWLDERPTRDLREQINTHTHVHSTLEVTVDAVLSSGLKQE